MKAIYLAVLLACIAGLGVVMMAESEDSEGAITNPTNATLVDDIWYTVWDGEAIVRGPSSNSLTTITIPSTVTIDGTSYPVTGIAGVPNSTGTGAFMDMLQLTTVTLPYTLESFNAQYSANTAGMTYSNAFGIYPSAQTRTSVLTTVNWNVPEGETIHLTSIGGQAFWNCSALTTFSVPDSVTYIGHNAFSGCSSWGLTAWPASLTTLGPNALGGTLTALTSLPSSITAVPNSLFNACVNITQFTLHSGVTSIGNYAFSGTGLTSFTIPDNVLTVGEGAFSSCTSLQTLTFPSGLTTIPNYVCSTCTSLTTVTMPSNYTSIGNHAFEYCSALHFTLSDSVTSVGEYAFMNCTSMGITSLPSGLTAIPNYAFHGAMGGSRLVIPATVTSVGDYAFGVLRDNGQAPSSMEIVFDGVKGASTNVVSVGSYIFDDRSFLPNPLTYPANTTMNVILYGKSYKSGSTAISSSNLTFSSNVSIIFDTYSIDSILSGVRTTIHYFATYDGVDYTRTLRSGSNWNAYAIGLADDTVTSITIPNQFYYYGTGGPYCAVQGVKGSQTADGYGAFGGSTSLTSATINYLGNMRYNPNGSNYSYANTFKDCVNLATVSLSSSITSLPYGIFSGCTSLDITWMPSNLKTFDAYAFEGCTSLTLSNINLTVNRADDSAFSGCILLNPASFTLGNSPVIGAYAFMDCENLTLGSLKNATLGEGAFSGCTALNVTSIEDTSVGDYAFENCTGLSSIVIQDSYLGDYAFNLSLSSEPTVEERTLSILFLDEIEYTEDTFASEQITEGMQAYDRIYNIVDLGGNNFTSQSSGLPADAQVSDTLTVNAMSMLQKIEQEEQHETVEDSSATSTILRVIPVFIVIGIILATVTMFYVNREGA